MLVKRHGCRHWTGRSLIAPIAKPLRLSSGFLRIGAKQTGRWQRGLAPNERAYSEFAGINQARDASFSSNSTPEFGKRIVAARRGSGYGRRAPILNHCQYAIGAYQHMDCVAAARDDVGDERFAPDAAIDGAAEIDAGSQTNRRSPGRMPRAKLAASSRPIWRSGPWPLRLEEEQGAAGKFGDGGERRGNLVRIMREIVDHGDAVRLARAPRTGARARRSRRAPRPSARPEC